MKISPAIFEREFRSHDWSATSLGPIESWMVPVAGPMAYMLHSCQPIFIIVGPEKLLLFNEAVSGMIGELWPQALGRNVTELWKPNWSDIGPLIERAYRGESFLVQDAGFLTWPSQFKVERYYTLAFTSLRSPESEHLGACCICNDTTERCCASGAWSNKSDVLAVCLINPGVSSLRRKVRPTGLHTRKRQSKNWLADQRLSARSCPTFTQSLSATAPPQSPIACFRRGKAYRSCTRRTL